MHEHVVDPGITGRISPQRLGFIKMAVQMSGHTRRYPALLSLHDTPLVMQPGTWLAYFFTIGSNTRIISS